MSVANTEEQEFWSGPSGQSWITYEARQDRLLSGALDAVMDRAGLGPGDRVLDIGCGAGALSVAAAETVGDKGKVLASDISAPLLDRAAERLEGFPHAGTLLADAQVAAWPETGFSHAVSRFGVMFFADPPEAFANIARALQDDGRMVFGAWAPAADNVYWRDPPRIAAARLGAPPKGQPNAPGPMGLADRDWSLDQLRLAGLKDVGCETVEITLPIDGTAEDAADLALVIGPASRVVRLFEATDDDIAAIRRDLVTEFQQYRSGDAIHIPALVHIYTARSA
ncbi:MAG: methyltransferase domain-containing protein [Rhodobacteraceae bacterium]|nr:MAG: methyltransferase domain-containing protein [Paracoccaceae bacterium]